METNNTIISPSDFTNFLDAGALLRVAPNEWFLLKGPFRESAQIPTGQVGLYHPDFFLSPNRTYGLPDKFYKLNDSELRALCEVFKTSTAPAKPLTWQDAELQSFQKSYSKIQERIQSESLQKAVPIVFETSSQSIGATKLVDMIKHLLSAPPSLFVYGFWENGAGILGATPEVLLRQQGCVLKTMALAGTCPKTESNRVSLLEDTKEMHEHDLVVKDITQALSAYGPIKTKGPSILELPTLLHLKTDIECELTSPSQFSFFEACERLHPTPALGVSPRSYGYEWMKELPEQSERGAFGAPWGLQWGADQGLCVVAIRNLQWNESGARIGSGCGIVRQSEVPQEWRELAAKRNSVKKILGLEA